MGRKLRYIPEGGAWSRSPAEPCMDACCSGPARELDDIAAGILGRAQRLYPVELIPYSLSSVELPVSL